MKDKDFRIGNYVYKNGEIHKVTAQTIFEVADMNEHNIAVVYTPIPLTEEYLDDFEFNRQGARKMWVKNRCCVVLHDFPDIAGNSTGEKFYIGYKDWGNVIYHTQFTVDYVHELQNAYSLTKEYLAISS